MDRTIQRDMEACDDESSWWSYMMSILVFLLFVMLLFYLLSSSPVRVLYAKCIGRYQTPVPTAERVVNTQYMGDISAI